MATDVVFIAQILADLKRVEHGFGPVRKAADGIRLRLATPTRLTLARQLLREDAVQARMLATFLLGDLAAGSAPAFKTLRDQVSRDPDWRVQEILAKAFDRYCQDTGYEQSLLVIDAWLAHRQPNVRRAVSEGLRIWTSRPYFARHPDAAISRLAGLRADPSDYVRRSAGNALRDISRKHKSLVAAELAGWDTTDARIAQTLAFARAVGGRAPR
jgi:hypothetical protein